MGVAEIAAPDPVGPLLFVNHKPSGRLDFEHERELQAVGAAQFVEELAARRGAHVVVAGDFAPRPTRPACASGSASDHFGVVADLVVRRRDQPLT